jgi:hypothetical protein
LYFLLFYCVRVIILVEDIITIELTNSGKALICREFIESKDFKKLTLQISLFAQKLITDNPENRNISFFSNWDELYTWVNKNISKTEYNDIIEFSEAFQEIKSIAQSLNQKYQVFFENKNNQVYLKEFVRTYVTNVNQEENAIQPLTATCLANLAHCTSDAKAEYDTNVAVGGAATIFAPIAGIALVAIAIIEYRDAVNACFAAYDVCDIP